MKKILMLSFVFLAATWICTDLYSMTRKELYQLTLDCMNANWPDQVQKGYREKLRKAGWNLQIITWEGPVDKQQVMNSYNVNPAELPPEFNNTVYKQLTEASQKGNELDQLSLYQTYRFSLASKTINGENYYVIAFCGTYDTLSKLMDALAVPTPWNLPDLSSWVHLGFKIYLDACNDDKYMKAFQDAIKKDPKPHVIITGHSLGAATASLEAAWMAEHNISKRTDMEVVVWAEPPPGLGHFGDKHLQGFKRYDNIMNTYDPVGILYILGYRPCGNLIGISFGAVDEYDNFLRRHDPLFYEQYINTITD